MPAGSSTSRQPLSRLSWWLPRSSRSAPGSTTTTAMPRCPRPTTCRAAARAPARSSMLTPDTSGSTGWSTWTIGRPRRRSQSRPSAPCRQEYPIAASIATSRAGTTVAVPSGGRIVSANPDRASSSAIELRNDSRELVGERVAQRFADQDADGSGGPAGQSAGRRIRPRVAQLGGHGQDSLAQRCGELVGAGERVRDGHRTHPDALGHRLQRHPPHVDQGKRVAQCAGR